MDQGQGGADLAEDFTVGASGFLPLADVRQVQLGLHHVGVVEAGVGQDGAELVQDVAGLGVEVLAHDAVLAAGGGGGDVEGVVHLDRPGVADLLFPDGTGAECLAHGGAFRSVPWSRHHFRAAGGAAGKPAEMCRPPLDGRLHGTNAGSDGLRALMSRFLRKALRRACSWTRLSASIWDRASSPRCGERGRVEPEVGGQLFQGLPAAELSQDRGAHQLGFQHHGHRGPAHDAAVELEPAGVLGQPGGGLPVRALPHAQILDQAEEDVPFPGDFRADPGRARRTPGCRRRPRPCAGSGRRRRWRRSGGPRGTDRGACRRLSRGCAVPWILQVCRCLRRFD